MANVYMHAWTLCHCQSSLGTDGVGVKLCRDKECLFNDVTSSGRVWRKVLERDVQSVNKIVIMQ